MNASVLDRLFFDQAEGSLYWKQSSSVTFSTNVGTTPPSVTECGTNDVFTLAQTGSYYLDLDMQSPQFTFDQSLFVTNSNWADSTQKVSMKLLNTAGTSIFVDVPYAAFKFSITGPANSLTINNVTH